MIMMSNDKVAASVRGLARAVDDRVRDVCYANRPVVEGDRALMMSAAAAARGNANGPGKAA